LSALTTAADAKGSVWMTWCELRYVLEKAHLKLHLGELARDRLDDAALGAPPAANVLER
jgi:hypothetical protein